MIVMKVMIGTHFNESARDAIMNKFIINYDRDAGSTINEFKRENQHTSPNIHTLESDLSDPRSISSKEISSLIWRTRI
jgi:hypothetical protein